MKTLICNIGSDRVYKTTSHHDTSYSIESLINGVWESIRTTSDPGHMARLLVSGGAAPDHASAFAILSNPVSKEP